VTRREVLEGAEFVKRVRARIVPGSRMMLARGRVFANPSRGLFGAFRLGPLELVAKGHVRLEDEAAMLELLDESYSVRRGQFDPGRVAWTADEDPFFLVTVEGEELWRVEHDALIGGDQRIEFGAVAAVQAYAGHDWVEQGVRLRLEDGGYVVVSSEQNTSVVHDWGYDGLTLSWDTAWARQLARRLSEALGVPFEDKI
jgi:hypothetical protein